MSEDMLALFTDCPECGETVEVWCDCPSCGWYDTTAYTAAIYDELPAGVVPAVIDSAEQSSCD